MSGARKWMGIALIGMLALLLILLAVIALMPERAGLVDQSERSSPAELVYPELDNAFPPSNEPPDNATTPEKVELGRLLFFDPILSENNDIACASCHHPDLGFADNRPFSTGASGVELTRNSPGLWNVAYAENLFWDGREHSLEAQVIFPLTHPDEMGVRDIEAMVAELQGIPPYADLFEQAFGDGEQAVTLENVERALAAFQRSLISDDSPFDRYTAGDLDALTPQQQRGLALFRADATHCFECHTPPVFANNTYRVIGVPDDDPGRAGVSERGIFGSFKVPTLRNIALTAPYMHDGSMATLEEVVEFYAQGGGRQHGFENMDAFILGFDLSAQEKADLVAFLQALTDESALPEIPASVPSGLPVVETVANPGQ